MKRTSIILCILIVFCTGCRKKDDPMVAQVYQYKLYASEVRSGMPVGLSADDSLAMARDYIDSWVKEKLVLHEAEKHLTPREKNFDKEMTEYRNSLLINRYYEKLWQRDTLGNRVTSREISEFARSLDSRYTVDKEIVRVNYAKIPTQHPALARAKEILFNESRRGEEKETLVSLLGDTIEYLLDDDEWLYLDDLQNEVAFQIDAEKTAQKGEIVRIEKKVGDNTILLVILDYRSQRSVNETKEERAAAGMLLMNQRKAEYINRYIQELYDKAVKAGEIVQ